MSTTREEIYRCKDNLYVISYKLDLAVAIEANTMLQADNVAVEILEGMAEHLLNHVKWEIKQVNGSYLPDPTNENIQYKEEA